MVRGEVFRLPAPRSARGREQRGARFAVIVQEDEFIDLNTVLVSPTSARLGRSAGRLDANELRSVDDALTLVLGL